MCQYLTAEGKPTSVAAVKTFSKCKNFVDSFTYLLEILGRCPPAERESRIVESLGSHSTVISGSPVHYLCYLYCYRSEALPWSNAICAAVIFLDHCWRQSWLVQRELVSALCSNNVIHYF